MAIIEEHRNMARLFANGLYQLRILFMSYKYDNIDYEDTVFNLVSHMRF